MGENERLGSSLDAVCVLGSRGEALVVCLKLAIVVFVVVVVKAAHRRTSGGCDSNSGNSSRIRGRRLIVGSLTALTLAFTAEAQAKAAGAESGVVDQKEKKPEKT